MTFPLVPHLGVTSAGSECLTAKVKEVAQWKMRCAGSRFLVLPDRAMGWGLGEVAEILQPGLARVLPTPVSAARAGLLSLPTWASAYLTASPRWNWRSPGIRSKPALRLTADPGTHTTTASHAADPPSWSQLPGY